MSLTLSNYASEDHRSTATLLTHRATTAYTVIAHRGIDHLEHVLDGLAVEVRVAWSLVKHAAEHLDHQSSLVGGAYEDARQSLAVAYDAAQNLADVLDACIYARDEFRRLQRGQQ